MSKTQEESVSQQMVLIVWTAKQLLPLLLMAANWAGLNWRLEGADPVPLLT
jgi:hypothetical protein